MLSDARRRSISHPRADVQDHPYPTTVDYSTGRPWQEWQEWQACQQTQQVDKCLVVLCCHGPRRQTRSRSWLGMTCVSVSTASLSPGRWRLFSQFNFCRSAVHGGLTWMLCRPQHRKRLDSRCSIGSRQGCLAADR